MNLSTFAILGEPGPADLFGGSLAVGDFDNDQFDDLAIGIAGKSDGDGTIVEFGAVSVIYGAPIGLTVLGNQLWTQDSPGVLDQREDEDHFGGKLAAGDFNGDNFSDLVIGVAGEDIMPLSDNEGAINVLYGADGGLSSEFNQFIHQDSPGIRNAAEEGDFFGGSLQSAN